MPEFDKNAAYIWACYGLGALMIAAITLQAVWAARRARRRLGEIAANDTDAA